MKLDKIAAYTASAETRVFLDALERMPRRDWLEVHRRFEQFSGPQWGRMFNVIGDAASEWRLRAKLSNKEWDEVLAEGERRDKRIDAIVARLPKAAAGDSDYREKMDYALRRRLVVMRVREVLEKTEKGRKVIGVVTGLFDGLVPSGETPLGDEQRSGTNTVPALAQVRRKATARKPSVSATYNALVKAMQRKEARFEQQGPYTPTHGEELFEELFLTLDGVAQNGGVRHYLDNPSGDGAERAKAYLAEIGAWRTLAVLDGVSTLFPNEEIPSRLRKRIAVLNAADKRMKDFNDPLGDADARYHAAQQELYTRLAAYVKANAREFPRPTRRS